MGLGSCITVSLAEARERALECRKLREKDIDPIDAREAARRQAAIEQVKALKFKDAAAAYMAAHRVAWKNDKHAAQWPATLTTIRLSDHRRVAVTPDRHHAGHEGDRADLVGKAGDRQPAARPHRNRARLGDRARLSPWRKSGTLARPSRQAAPVALKSAQDATSSALPYAELPAFLIKLREQDGVAARALEFTILTAARTGETIGAKRDEIDTKNKLWTIPAERMKAGKDHRVPLSDRALKIIEDVGTGADDKDSSCFRGEAPASR